MVASYKQFCPVAMAAEVLETRWTLLIIRELCLGSKHFNELRRGVPKMSPTLLSKRPHSALGYRPPAPETNIKLDQRPTIH